MRFSADKSPYKTAQGAVLHHDTGAVYYVALSADGLFAASGYYMMAKDQVDRFRKAVASEKSGPPVERTVAKLEKAGYEIGGEALRRAPAGYPVDHPRIRLLRHKGMTMSRSWEPAAWVGTATAKTARGRRLPRRHTVERLARRSRRTLEASRGSPRCRPRRSPNPVRSSTRKGSASCCSSGTAAPPTSSLARTRASTHPSTMSAIARRRRSPADSRAWTITAIYASDLARAVQTAGYLAASRDVDVQQREDLREVWLGEWERGEFPPARPGSATPSG